MKAIYKTIKGLLEQITDLKYIDLDYGQLDEDQPPVTYPCALINISIPQAADMGGKMQQCKCIITIRLGFNATGGTSNSYPQQAIDNSLYYFDIVDAVYKKLQGYTDDQLEELSRKSVIQDVRQGLKITVMPFETAFEDWTAAVDLS